jgi:hypothetical protein
MKAGMLTKSMTLDGGKLAVGVALKQVNDLLDLWVGIVTDHLTLDLKPNEFRIHIITPVGKELAPIEDWKLSLLRIGNTVRLRKTTLNPGGIANGYVVFPNEKQRESVVVEIPLNDLVLEFPFDFTNGSKTAR